MMNMKCTYPFGLTRQLLLLALAMLLAFSSVPSVYGKSKPKSGKSAKGPLFSQFVYQGDDDVYKNHPLAAGEFTTPFCKDVIQTPASPAKVTTTWSALLLLSSRVPIFHSRFGELETNWACARSYFTTQGARHAHECRVYAPDIKYNANNDTFI